MTDTSIYSRFMPPERSMQDYLDEYDARDQKAMQNKLNGLMLQDKQRGLEEQNQLRDYFKNNDPNSPNFVNGLYGISPTQGEAFAKARLNSRKDQTEIDAKTFKLASDREQGYKSTLAALHDRPDLSKQMAVTAMQSKLQQGLITQQMFDHIISDLPDDPNQLRQQLLQGLKEQLAPEQKLTLFAPKVSTVDNGKEITRVDDNPNSPTFGRQIGAPAVQKVAGPEAVLTDQRTREEGALNRKQANDHFNITQGNAGNTYDPERGVVVNTRTQTATPVTANGKPLGAKEKPMTEGQAKANLFGSRMQAADKILTELTGQGVEQAGLIKRAAGSVPLVGGGLATMTNFTQSDKQQQVEQAQRDFLNAVLRRESGAVIGQDEFASAQQQYFPQPNDGPKVKKQKADARKLAIEGILAEVPGKASPQRNVNVDW